MQRRILIIDDHDDLATSLNEAFATSGHQVVIFENREDAIDTVDDLDQFDIVVTDLDDPNRSSRHSNNGTANGSGTSAKVFKIAAPHFRGDGFNEDELKNFIETILDYKIRFVDRPAVVRDLHETIEFELPSAISPMHAVLEYLLKRVEKLGGVKPEQSNLFVALDEAFVNAVKHGNKFDSRKLIRICADVTPQEARFTIEDEGEGFDVNSIPDPRDPTNLFKSSGRGVLFIYNIMDEVSYNERGNRLTMVKRCSNAEACEPEKTTG
jgi:serine/threonine-protein kinase RsbW